MISGQGVQTFRITSVCLFISGDALVDCTLDSFQLDNPNPLYRCRVRKPYPLKKNGDLSFTIIFPLDNHINLGEFSVNFNLKTEEDDRIHASESFTLKIKVDYTMRVERYVTQNCDRCEKQYQ